jgi:hypothetical protein
MTIEKRQKQREYEKTLVLSCVKNGRVLFKDIIKKTGWSKQKAVALCYLLTQDGILGEKSYCFCRNKFKGFYVKGY